MNTKELEAKVLEHEARLDAINEVTDELRKELGESIGRITALEELVTALTNGKQRGPKTERAMTDKDAYTVKFGELKDKNHKEAAAELGLSYGQVFSCRGGYTFKAVRADWLEKNAPKDGAA